MRSFAVNDSVAAADNEVSSLSLPRFPWNAMFDGNVYYCWFCDAHRRGIPGVAGTKVCPRCQKDLSESARLTRHSEFAVSQPERRPIYAMGIGHPVANSAPAWSGNVAAAS